MLRQKISSNAETMQELHLQYGWIPGSVSIRPTPDIIEKKNNYIANMLNRYVTLQDFVLHRFFGLKPMIEGEWTNSRLRVSDSEIASAQLAAREKFNHH